MIEQAASAADHANLQTNDRAQAKQSSKYRVLCCRIGHCLHTGADLDGQTHHVCLRPAATYTRIDGRLGRKPKGRHTGFRVRNNAHSKMADDSGADVSSDIPCKMLTLRPEVTVGSVAEHISAGEATTS